MRSHGVVLSLAILLSLGTATATPAPAAMPQSAVSEAAPQVTAIKAEAPITSVTVYQGRAAVTRSTTLKVAQGVFSVRFGNLPAAIQSQTLQSKVGEAARLVNVEYLETPVADLSGSPQMLALTQQIETSKRGLTRLQEDLAMLAAQAKVVDQIGVRASGDASRDAGSERLNVDALRKQLEFVQSERARLVAAQRDLADKIVAAEREVAALDARRNALGARDRIERSAEVTIAVPQAGEVPISLTYLVENAGWEPMYSVRGASDRSSVTLEFDANLVQQSGEDWSDVALIVSTAQPTVRANPPTITPVFVSVVVPPPPIEPRASKSPAIAAAPPPPPPPGGEGGYGFGGGGGGGSGGNGGDDQDGDPDTGGMADSKWQQLKSWSGEAAVVEGGTAVSYELPRRVTVPSNADRKTRTRVATITPTARFVYTAIPLLTDAVYLRGKLVNESAYQLVPGPAQVFMGTEYIGPTRIASVAPKGEFTVYFGIDRSIRAVRTMVTKNTSESGVFSKTRDVTRSYRITIENGSGRAIDLELFDRRPVSQNERITVTVDALSSPLSTDAEYVRDQLPQGIMRWDLTVPPTSTGVNAMAITWTTSISAARDLQLTPVSD